MARILNENEEFEDGKEYRCLSLGLHGHWNFKVGQVYKANEYGLIDEDGDECYESYYTMQFETVEGE